MILKGLIGLVVGGLLGGGYSYFMRCAGST